MGEEVKRPTYDHALRREYRRKVQLCLDVFETMLSQSHFDSDRPLTGMEIECNLVDADYQPAMSNRYVLDAIADPAYQSELGAYNIEFNVPPRSLPGHTALDLEAEVRASLNDAEFKASSGGAHIVMIGILPTLMPEHFNNDWMSESRRYAALNESIFNARGEDIPINISGPEPLSWNAATIAPESACTSMQLHLQVAPADFAANWNAAQVLAGPQLALGANSPYFFGHELWSETRIELFTQSTDARPDELKLQPIQLSSVISDVVTTLAPEAEQMRVTSIAFPKGVEEPKEAGLSLAPSSRVGVPRIAQAPVSMECIFMQEIALGSFGLVLGKILMVHVKDEAVTNAVRQHVDAEKLDLIGRMEGGWYTRTRDRFEMPAIALEDWKGKP